MAGITPAVTSPFGNSGQNIGSPATPPPVDPGTQADFGGVEGIVTGNGKPATPVVDPNAAPADPFSALEEDLSAFDQGLAGLEGDLAGGNPPPASGDEMSNLPAPEGIASLKEQFGESVARMKNAFAVTGPESVAVLKQSGLFDDVRDQGGTIQVKRKGRGGWENFDRDKFELVGDVLDFARDGIEAIAEKGAQLAGGAAGVAIGAPTGPGAAATGYGAAAASGAAGAVAAKNAGDFIAQKILGIPRDPKRSAIMENSIAAGFGAGFAMLGSAMARRAAAKAAARTEATKTIEYAAEQVNHTLQDINEVKNSGIVLGENGAFRLDPQQAVGAGQIPELDVTAKELSTEQSFRNFRKQVGDSIQNAYDSVAKTVGAIGGKTANIGEDFVLSAKDVRKAEGTLIGSFRKLADEKLAGKPQPSPRFMQTLEAMAQETAQSADDFALAAGITPGQAKQLKGLLSGYSKRIQGSKGMLTLDEAGQLQKQIQGIIDANVNSQRGRPVAAKLFDLRDAIREDAIDMMGNVLPQSQMENFAKAKGRYRTIIDATSQLGKMLDNENISRNELINKLFEGKGSYKFAQSAKTLIQETNPEMWQNLAGEYFTKLRNEATDATGRNVNWAQMARKWRDLDPRIRTELMDASGIKQEGMEALLRLGAKVQAAGFEAMPREAQSGFFKRQLKNIFNLYGGASAKGTAITSMISGMGKDQAMAKWLKDGGMEEILKEMPGLKPSKAAELRSWMASWTPTPVRTGAAALSTATKATAKAASRNQTIEAVTPDTEAEQ